MHTMLLIMFIKVKQNNVHLYKDGTDNSRSDDITLTLSNMLYPLRHNNN